MKKLKAAVIGIGNMGRHHARIYSELEETELVAVADLNKDLGEKITSSFGGNFYLDYQEMLDKEKPDIVSVATPTSTHYKIGMECLKRKIHVLVEKPIASSVAEGEKLIKEATKQGVVLMVGHVERFNPAIEKIKELIEGKKIGDVRVIVCRRGGMPANARIKDVNVIIDIGIHDIDILNYLYSSYPKEMLATGGRALLSRHEDYANIYLKYSLDKSGYIQVDWITPRKIRKIYITGTKGYIEADYITQEIEMYQHPPSYEINNSFEEYVRKYIEVEGEKIDFRKEEPLKLEISNFISSILGKEPLRISPKEALFALKIALQASELIKKRR